MKSLIYSKPKILTNKTTKLGESPIWNHASFEFSYVDIKSKKFSFTSVITMLIHEFFLVGVVNVN